jgi:hypothetical protein
MITIYKKEKKKKTTFFDLEIGDTFVFIKDGSDEDIDPIVFMKVKPFTIIDDKKSEINTMSVFDGSPYYTETDYTVYPVKITAEWERI